MADAEGTPRWPAVPVEIAFNVVALGAFLWLRRQRVWGLYAEPTGLWLLQTSLAERAVRVRVFTYREARELFHPDYRKGWNVRLLPTSLLPRSRQQTIADRRFADAVRRWRSDPAKRALMTELAKR